MANLKQIRKHILSVRGTGKITSAMKMVAVAKLRRAQEAVVSTRPYVSGVIGVIEHLILKTDASDHPMLRNSENPKNGVLYVLSGDKGLCGAYNHNIVKAARKFIADYRAKGKELKVICLGKKAYDVLSKMPGVDIEAVPNAWSAGTSELALSLSKQLCDRFLDNQTDEAFVLYTKFKSAIAQIVVLDAILPLKSILKNEDLDEQQGGVSEDRARELNYIYEPDAKRMLDLLLPRVVSVHLQRSILEAQASEHGARMTAMDNASKNANQMISNLTLTYNRARQAAITTELIEVVSGAEAL